jgi:hypothetical protein
VSTVPTGRSGAKVYPAKVKAVLDHALANRPGVEGPLAEVLDRFPEFADRFGDLAGHVERALIDLLAGDSLLVRESVARKVAALRANLAGSDDHPAVRLLADRVALCWLAVHQADLDRATALKAGTAATPARKMTEARADRAHARYLSATKALATCQTLLRPAPSPLQMLRPAAGKPAGANRVADRLSAGVG